MKKIFIIAICVFLLSCEKENGEHGPYDPYSRLPEFSAEISDRIFNPPKITIFTPDDLTSPIGVTASDSIYSIGIRFPRDCGKKTFYFPEVFQNAELRLNNIVCTSGKLSITKYDVNWVEGNFEFEANINNSNVIVKKGNFLIIYRLE